MRATSRLGEQERDKFVVVPRGEKEEDTAEDGQPRKRKKFKDMGVPTEEMALVSSLERTDKQRLEMEQMKIDNESHHFEEYCEERKRKRLE